MNQVLQAKRAPSRGAVLLACFWLVSLPSLAAIPPNPLPTLTSAAEVRNLPPEEAARHYPFHIRGLVTFFDQKQFLRFVQDDTCGIYFYFSDTQATKYKLRAGDMIDIVGRTSQGEYAPIIEPRQIQKLGIGAFPEAKTVGIEQLSSGQEDSQYVGVHGIVRSVRWDSRIQYYLVDIATGGDRITAFLSTLPGVPATDLVDASVTVRGVCLTRFNRQRQLFNTRLLVPRAEDLVIEKPPPATADEIPARPIASLLQFSPQGTYGHRVKVVGTVIDRQNENKLYIQDDSSGLFVQTVQPGGLLVGDRVEVVGFAARGDYTPMLQDSDFHKIGTGETPRPVEITADQALKGSFDCRLVRIEATLLDRGRNAEEDYLVLESGGLSFHAYLERAKGVDFAYVHNGSVISVTGVCLIETGNDWHAGDDWRAKSFRIVMRSSRDVTVLRAGPWWNLQKLLWIVGILAGVVFGAFAWVAVLRRRVQEQTQIIRQKLDMVATLKERYEDLFENANDMVYTHDLAGRITSINQAGENLLQRSRGEVLSRNIIDFVADEERPAAQQWLEEVVKGTASPTAEWDFVASAGQRVRLEISTRLIEQSGKIVEIEGTARDITERKRLEREILEISNREQRRIGHDLHDGVCQQLAGIALMTASLADQLEEKGMPESTQTERISGLINNAITQTRGVARGLFPVRLEENGLVSALEELAANSSELFKINCQFSCVEAPATVDNEIALHLYYIVLEAVANACKHGGASNVFITLEAARDRYSLTVRDDGKGFSPAGKPHTGMGIRIMEYRARVIGANFTLQSAPGSGTQLTCLFFAVSRNEPVENGNGKAPHDNAVCI
ncbi:MAG TPA: PAS domain S-box protein [Verrucomicrobiae bacterium]|nr:PAS domain S-box protein [Verrucomicrobiae bacterium]